MTYPRKLLYRAESEQNPDILLEWANAEYQKIEVESSHPNVNGISFEINYAVPDRYKEGDLYYGAAGVFGGAAGLYIRDGNSWRKL
jgi:hypothetical protein